MSTPEPPLIDFSTILPTLQVLVPMEVSTPEELDKCNIPNKNNSNNQYIGGYEGIPQNLLMNSIFWIILVSMFSLLRIKVWKYDRQTLLREDECGESNGDEDKSEDKDELVEGDNRESDTSPDPPTHQGFCSWVPALFNISEDQIAEKCGVDAMQYLSFQRHVFGFMTIVCFISIVIALPVNFQGTLEGGPADFGHTTLANLSPKSGLVWVHATFGFLFLPIAMMIMWQFSKRLRLTTTPPRALMVSRVPRAACQKDIVKTHFREAYPDLVLQDVEFSYNVKSLIDAEQSRRESKAARIYCEKYLDDTGTRLLVWPFTCGKVCGRCSSCCTKPVDAIDFYAEEEARLCAEVESLRVRALQRPTGVAFFFLSTPEGARQVMRDHKRGAKCQKGVSCMRDLPTSSVSTQLKTYNWFVGPAPSHNDIYWANLSITNKLWWPKAILINSILFVILFLFTTPSLILQNLDSIISALQQQITVIGPAFSEILPTLMLWTVSAGMPVVVAYSDKFMSHWTRSAENYSVMVKTYTFLLLMIVILPSLGLTSAQALVEWVFQQNKPGGDEKFRWECVFMADNGALFVNYVITAAFLGTSLELVRLPQLLLLMIKLSTTRSEAESANVRKAMLLEFPFGVQYAWFMLIVAMTTIFSLSCPLITPFGTLCVLMKHLVDKYNIYYVFKPSCISTKIHITAINFVFVSILLLQLILLFFCLVRLGRGNALTVYSIVLFTLTCLVLVLQHIFSWFSPKGYRASIGKGDAESEGSEDGEGGQVLNGASPPGSPVKESCAYVPAVLRDIPCDSPTHSRDYGSISRCAATEMEVKSRSQSPSSDKGKELNSEQVIVSDEGGDSPEAKTLSVVGKQNNDTN